MFSEFVGGVFVMVSILDEVIREQAAITLFWGIFANVF